MPKIYHPTPTHYNRDLDATPQVNPVRTPWNEPTSELIFFGLPQRIGELISGYSTYYKGQQKFSFSQYIGYCLKKSLIGFIIVGIIMGILFITWTNNHVSHPGRSALIGFGIIYGIILIIILIANENLKTFQQLNYYIGLNGFAYSIMEGTPDNIITKFELNFKHVTHLFSSEVKQYKNYRYDRTNFNFSWYNNNTKELLYKLADNHSREDGDLPKHAMPFYWMNMLAEKCWTKFLLDNMDNELQKKGFIEFIANLDGELMPFVRLEPGKITVINGYPKSYNKEDIKKMYMKKGNFYIEHVNYSKGILSDSGQKDFIPINALANKDYFFAALNLLIGKEIE